MMRIDYIDRLCRTLNTMTATGWEVKCRLDELLPFRASMVISAEGEDFARIGTDDDIVSYCGGTQHAQNAFDTLETRLASPQYQLSEYFGIVYDVVMNYDLSKAKDFIRSTCMTEIELPCIRLFCNGKRNKKTICGLIDRKLAGGQRQ